MSRTLLVAALLALVACSTESPVEPEVQQLEGPELKWTTTYGGYGWAFGIRTFVEGRTIDIECGSNSSSATPSRIRTRVNKKGEEQTFVDGPFEESLFLVQDNTDGYPGPILEELTGVGGRQTVRETIAYPPKWITKVHIRSVIGGEELDCRMDYDIERDGLPARRIMLGDRCWSSDPILPCP